MTPLRVLYLEDSPTDRDLVVRQLERLSPGEFVMAHATDLAQARAALAAGRFDVVLSDLNVPDSEGVATVKSLLAAGCKAPIIAFTGSLDPRHGVEAVEAGATDFATKGLTDPLTLANRIRFAARRGPGGLTSEKLEAVVAERTAAIKSAMEALDASKHEVVEQKARLDLFMAQVPYCCFLQDTQTGQFSFVSPAYETIFGGSVADLKANPLAWLPMVHDDDKDRVHQSFVRAGADEGPRNDIEFRINTAAGPVRWVRVSWMPLSNAGGKAHRAGVLADITDERELEDALAATQRSEAKLALEQESGRFKSQFLNMAAHDLATPITPLRLQVATLKMQAKTRGDQLAIEGMALLDRNLIRLSGLIQDVLDVGRIEAGRVRLKSDPIPLGDLVRDATQTIKAMAEAKKQTLAFEIEDLRPAADPERTSQVLLNLLSNAVKYTPEGGRIHVMMRVEVGKAVVEVHDDGRGISVEDQAKLFQPFARLGDTHKVEGTGLGLYISRGLARAMSGDLVATSAGEGKGSTFTLLLPLQTQSTAAAS